ncbi:MAG: hypothetical protein EBT96_10480 [Betaproteobacteria bacterium]|nr:hypothetical protein [Betaproteobacteria bacterium]
MWATRGVQALAILVLMQCAWAWWAAHHEEAAPAVVSALQAVIASPWALAGLVLLGGVLGVVLVLLMKGVVRGVVAKRCGRPSTLAEVRTPLQGAHAPAWVLRFDGQCWHWWGAHAAGGSGRLSLALACGPWCLLRAVAAPGHGRSAWIWLRPSAVATPAGGLGGGAARLRTLLNWT